MVCSRTIVLAVLIAASALGACTSTLPTYPVLSDADALIVIAERQASVRSLTAECDLDLTDGQGQRISLDGVLVAEPPGKLRLRAWKFGHAVFDMTLTDGHGWVMVPEEGPAEVGAHRLDVANIPAKTVGDALALLGPSYFRTAKQHAGDAATLIARGRALGRDDVECEIERSTLTPRRFVVGDAGDAAASELLLDEYATVNTIAWPMRMRLRSPSGEVMVRIRELELNGEIPAGAFTPPARAKALP